ncbi:MAG: hypothetical protein LKI21_06435 [Bifidobacterium crudilactis]|nr:hypothetical protein [Bifidobacterium crudilactis]
MACALERRAIAGAIAFATLVVAHFTYGITGVIPFATLVVAHFTYGITGVIPFATLVVAHFACAERTAFRT